MGTLNFESEVCYLIEDVNCWKMIVMIYELFKTFPWLLAMASDADATALQTLIRSLPLIDTKVI